MRPAARRGCTSGSCRCSGARSSPVVDGRYVAGGPAAGRRHRLGAVARGGRARRSSAPWPGPVGRRRRHRTSSQLSRSGRSHRRPAGPHPLAGHRRVDVSRPPSWTGTPGWSSACATPPVGAGRSPAATSPRGAALVAVHTCWSTGRPGSSRSLDPPPDAAAAAAGCRNDGCWPVLVGDDDADACCRRRSSCRDQPAIAPESPGDLFDATEIDEILTLRMMTLTEEEKADRARHRPAGGRDHRPLRRDAAGWTSLHGALPRRCTAGGEPTTARTPWWDPAPTRPCRRRPTPCWSPAWRWPRAAGCGCGRPAGPTRRTCSWPARTPS